ncbi:hypothetical protein ABPG75_001523 [Micractinium tetrahymenae]
MCRVDEDSQRRGITLADWGAGTLGKNVSIWGGRYVDVRSPAVREVQRRRLEWMAGIGCDGVDPDNTDIHWADTGLNLTRGDLIGYIKCIADTAHNLCMAVGLKNAGDLLPDVGASVDWVVTESCFATQQCALYDALSAAKPVISIEYCDASVLGATTQDPACFCLRALAKGWDQMVKQHELGAPGIGCARYCELHACGSADATGPCPAAAGDICNATLPASPLF